MRLVRLLTGRGTIDRGRFAFAGVVLFILKHNLDRLLADALGRSWNPLDYWIPSSLPLDELPSEEQRFFAWMLVLALPFLWIGLVLTLARLRDAGLPLWLAALFFVPVVNLLFFVVLSFVPTRTAEAIEAARSPLLARLIPRGVLGSAATAIVVTALLGLLFTVLGAEILTSYGWGLFVGVPFMLGLLSSLIYGYHEPRSPGECAAVALAASGLAGLALLGLAFEGVICLLMAAPIVLPLAVLGGWVGYVLQSRPEQPSPSSLYCAVVLAVPAIIGGEASIAPQARVTAVTTHVIVEAPPARVWPRVWPHVIAFPQLPPPTELLFRAGIAYPVHARIEGSGVGAVRHCVFSTGEFVEPITVWRAPHLLRFDVVRQATPLREVSPWGDIRPPHLDGFLLSRQGEFRLTALPSGRTLLAGTTWYENRMWPARYWRLWSDEVIRGIHLRVLRHVKRLSEGEPGLTNS